MRAGFVALPETVTARYFRGDSACHENALLAWLAHPDRAQEPGGAIGFAVSAVQTEALAAALRAVPATQWQTFGTEADGTLRQWAEVDFVPGLPSEHKDAQPLRYVGLRLVKAQGELFADGSRYHYHAVITNPDSGCRGRGVVALASAESWHDRARARRSKKRSGRRTIAEREVWGERGVVSLPAAGVQRGQRATGTGAG